MGYGRTPLCAPPRAQYRWVEGWILDASNKQAVKVVYEDEPKRIFHEKMEFFQLKPEFYRKYRPLGRGRGGGEEGDPPPEEEDF